MVLKMPMDLFVDAYSVFNLGGSSHSVNASYIGFLHTSMNAQNKRSSNMCTVAAPGAEWQPEQEPTARIFALMSKGCLGLVKVGEDIHTVSVIIGVHGPLIRLFT